MVPYPGEFPVVELLPSNEDSFKVFNLMLSASSSGSFENMNDEQYEKWWGVCHRDKTLSTVPESLDLISVSQGLYHFADMLHTNDDSYTVSNHSSFQCSLSRILNYILIY